MPVQVGSSTEYNWKFVCDFFFLLFLPELGFSSESKLLGFFINFVLRGIFELQ